MTSRNDGRAEIRQFLTTRRAKLTPEQAGLVPGALGRPRRGLYRSGVQPFHHPLVGDLTLNYDALELPADPGLTIVAYTAEAGSPAQQMFDLLASWTSTPGEATGVTSDADT
jgi:hypothetical protein